MDNYVNKMEVINNIWNKALSVIKDRIPNQSYEAWFKPMKILSCDDTKIVFEVPSAFFKDWIVHHYIEIIKSSLEIIDGQKREVELTIAPIQPGENQNLFADIPPEMLQKTPEKLQESDIFLTSKYSFNNFVIGNSNRFAHAASLAVAETPAKSYNPLVIYGGVGLGKTHLLYAIGKNIKEKNPALKVVYITSEQFMNEMIGAIKMGYEQMIKFRNKYRTVDVLMIDDIQFLGGKESTQEEFFHTFNALYEANRQIVASSDAHPKEINLEERLKSRFEMGLVADIQPPDFETRVAILMKKAEVEKTKIPDDVISFIADKISSNIRELEGALIRVVAYATLTDKKISIDLASQVLRDIVSAESESNAITIEKIKKAVIAHFNLNPSDMTVKKRTKDIAYPRQLAMYLCRELTNYSLLQIGKSFGGRDHSTVIHAYDIIKNKMEIDSSVSENVKKLISIIKNE